MLVRRSANGWTAYRRDLISTFVVPGTSVRLPLRTQYAGPLLIAFAHAFHLRVEPLRAGWCWGYAPRKIRGSVSRVSNHASGTAIDVNAPRHPLGARGTFTAAQTAEIRRLVRLTGGALRWGGDYAGRADEMHLEVVTTDVALILRATVALRAEHHTL
jgi:hypothetical protein